MPGSRHRCPSGRLLGHRDPSSLDDWNASSKNRDRSPVDAGLLSDHRLENAAAARQRQVLAIPDRDSAEFVSQEMPVHGAAVSRHALNAADHEPPRDDFSRLAEEFAGPLSRLDLSPQILVVRVDAGCGGR